MTGSVAEAVPGDAARAVDRHCNDYRGPAGAVPRGLSRAVFTPVTGSETGA